MRQRNDCRTIEHSVRPDDDDEQEDRRQNAAGIPAWKNPASATNSRRNRPVVPRHPNFFFSPSVAVSSQ